jgi:hypothetical protein
MVLATGQITLTDLNDVRQYLLYLNGNHKTQIFDPNTGVYNPNFTSSNAVLTPELYVSGGDGSNLLPSSQVKSVRWYEGTQTDTPLTETTAGTTPNGLSYSLPTGDVKTTSKTLTIKSNLTNMNNQIFTAVVVYTDPNTNFDVTIKTSYDLVKITNGQRGSDGADAINALTALLSNEAANVPTDSSGNNGLYTNTGTEIRLFEGSTELVYDGTGTSNGTWKVTAAATGITAGAITDGGSHAIVANASNMTADSAKIVYTITGKRANGTAISLTKTQTFSKSKTGVAPIAYWMTLSAAAVQKDISGNRNPSTLTAKGYQQQGTGAPTNPSTGFKFVVDTSTDGDTFTNNVGSPTAATGSTSHSVASSTKAVRFRMYRAADTPTTSNFVDEQIVPVVTDGATGQTGAPGEDAFFLNLWAPEGDTIRNGNGSIKLQADLYKGAGKVTPTAFKWYIQNPAATTSSLGDADGGAGWEKLTGSNHGISSPTGASITVPANAIPGAEGFKVVATAPETGEKYTGVIIVRDFQDPISVNVLGASIFKNGEGSVTLTAQLLQAGSAIPSTGYTFTWALYATNGNLIKTYSATGDTITVPASDVTGTANLVVDVNKS